MKIFLERLASECCHRNKYLNGWKKLKRRFQGCLASFTRSSSTLHCNRIFLINFLISCNNSWALSRRNNNEPFCFAKLVILCDFEDQHVPNLSNIFILLNKETMTVSRPLRKWNSFYCLEFSWFSASCAALEVFDLSLSFTTPETSARCTERSQM